MQLIHYLTIFAATAGAPRLTRIQARAVAKDDGRQAAGVQSSGRVK